MFESRFPKGEWRLVEQGDANEFVILSDGNRWVVSFRQNGEMSVVDQRAIGLLMAASKDMFAALDIADAAFAVLNVQDLGGQARACIREAWPLVQSARAKACPDGAYADAVKEVQQHEIARLDGVVKQLVDAVLYRYPRAHAHLSDKTELQKIMQLVKEVRGDEA